MGAFSNDNIVDSGDPVKDDGPMASFNIVEGSIGNGSGNGQAKTHLTDSCEKLSHCVCEMQNAWIIREGNDNF